MALSAPRTRPWSTGRIPRRFLAFGLALALALSVAYAAVVGNPFARTATTPTYQTAAVTQGSVQVAVSGIPMRSSMKYRVAS